MGYFNLGSTIVMIFEADKIEAWHKREGDKVCYGEPFCTLGWFDLYKIPIISTILKI